MKTKEEIEKEITGLEKELFSCCIKQQERISFAIAREINILNWVLR